MLSKKDKQKIIEKHRVHQTDTGSPEVQISILTKKIKELSAHLKKNRGDNHSRRGLIGMINKRRAHLSYLKKKDPQRHENALKVVKEDKQ